MTMRKDIDPEARKAALYIRVSTKYQAEDGDSLPMQRDELPKYVQYALGITDFVIFEDAGYSAKNTDRPDYQRMMARVRQGEFSHIVVWKLDRISRNLLDFASMYAELKRLGVIFISKNEQFDTSTAIGEAMLKIILVFAELERNMTSERVTATMISRAQAGQWNGGKVPFGYEYDKASGTFSFNEAEKRIVLRLYDKYETLRSLLQVAAYLNENGLFNRSGIPWNPTTVRLILVNPFYVGTYRYNRLNENQKTFTQKSKKEWVLIPDHHPAMIPEERQNRIIDILSSNDRVTNLHKSYQRKNIHIFGGLIECGACGNLFQSSVDRPRAESGWRPSVYLCSRHRRFKDCENKYVSDITIGPFILNFISNYIRASRNIGKDASLDILERKLLRGDWFPGTRIDRQSLEDIRRSFLLAKYGIDGPEAFQLSQEQAPRPDDREMLAAEVKRLERAMSRLKSLYMFADAQMTEQEYVQENNRLAERLADVNAKLEELDRHPETNPASGGLDDEIFFEQASFLSITEELLSRRFVDYEKLIRTLDKNTLKLFINSVVKKIVIFQGQTLRLELKNGISIKFLYDGQTPDTDKEPVTAL